MYVHTVRMCGTLTLTYFVHVLFLSQVLRDLIERHRPSFNTSKIRPTTIPKSRFRDQGGERVLEQGGVVFVCGFILCVD